MSGPGDCTSRESAERRTTVVPLPVGIGVMLFGLAVHVARHADLPLFIQLHPTAAPMKYSTALCFLCSGGALLALRLNIRRLALPPGSRRRRGGVARAGGVCLRFRSRNRPTGVPCLYLHPDFAFRQDVAGGLTCLPHGGSSADRGGHLTPAPVGKVANWAPDLAGHRAVLDGSSRLRDLPNRHVWLGHLAGNSRSIATGMVPESPSPSNYRLSLP